LEDHLGHLPLDEIERGLEHRLGIRALLLT
jgi:hypothetical protein